MARKQERSRFGNAQRTGRLAPQPPSTTARPPVVVRQIADGVPLDVHADVSFEEALKYTEGSRDRMILTVLSAPHQAEISELADAWNLHPLLVEDLMHGGQRPKVERYGDVLFLVVRSARYIDEIEEVEFSEFHLVTQPQALTVICQDGRLIDGTEIGSLAAKHEGNTEAPLGAGAPLLDNHALLRLGPEAVVYRLLDTVVDGYFPVLDGLQIDKEQIERQVFSGDPAAAERIYHLSQEVIDLLHAATALAKVLERLRIDSGAYGIPNELQTYLQDVSDHLVRVVTETTSLRDSLSQILNVNATLVSQRQNEDMKKISGWAAVLFAPTLVAAIYGMNFDRMPELHWAWGYPLAVGVMVAFAVGLYVIFKRKKWM